MKPENSSSKKVQEINIEEMAKDMTEQSGYWGEEETIYQKGIELGYARALLTHEKAINLHDHLIAFIREFNEFNFNDKEMLKKSKELLQQSEQK